MIALDNELLKKIRDEFYDSFINKNNELILIPKTNLYFLLSNVETELDLKCKLLEWCSRDACKAMPFDKDWQNNNYNNLVRENINNVLKTNFSEEEMEDIYCKLGNCVNRKKTIKFINSNYDMSILKGEDR